jgi:predicted transposase/invertase (TIGR01784 family)
MLICYKNGYAVLSTLQIFSLLLFELIDQPPLAAEGYEVVSVEVKEKAFRFDGIFLPDGVDKPIIFTEVQFQPKVDFYWAFVSEIYLYLNQYKPAQNWQAVAIFARRSYDRGELPHFQELFASDRIVRVYLEDWLDRESSSLGIAIVQLILAPEAKAPELARRLAVQVERETTPLLRDEVVEFIETVLVYKFGRVEVGYYP